VGQPSANQNKPATIPIRAADDIAKDTSNEQSSDSVVNDSDSPASASQGSWLNKLNLQWPPRKKEWIIIAVVVAALVAAVVSTQALTRGPAPVASVTHKTKAKPVKVVAQPATVPSTLTGLPVEPSVNKRPVTAVMVENSLDARPQSGLGPAGVVFEAIAEGGVTRFMAVYEDTTPENVGPIRSARPYYVAWSLGFEAGYAHVGGSPDGLADIKSWGVRDLDQFANGGSYHRIDSREAPHNVYSSILTLQQLEASKGYNTSTYTGFVRKAAAPSKAPNATSIDLSLSGYYYNPHFQYNASTNSYDRSEAGAPHIDQNSGQVLSPSVVIAMVTPLGRGELDSSDAYYSDYTVIGSGAAYIFQDGVIATGHWNKASNTSQITFTDDAGKTMGLNPGQTWLTAVSSTNSISYNP
jgi:hypothetical protein